MQNNSDPLFNEQQTADFLGGWSVKTLQRRRWLRQEPAYLKVGRLIRYRMSDLQAFLDKCRIEPREV